MIASEAFKRTQRAQASDWEALTASPSGVATAPHGAPVASPRVNPWGLVVSIVALVGGTVETARYSLLTPAQGAGPAAARAGLVCVDAVVVLFALRYLLFTARGRVAVTGGHLTFRGPLRQRTWPADAVTRVVAFNTSTQAQSPHIHYLFLGESRSLVYLSGTRFGLDAVERVATALNHRVEALREPVTVKHLLAVKNGRVTLPTP